MCGVCVCVELIPRPLLFLPPPHPDDIFTCSEVCGAVGPAVASGELPAVKFPYDIDPMTVRVHRESEAFYVFLTKLLGILGGVFTLMSMCNTATKGAIQTVKKLRMGKQS